MKKLHLFLIIVAIVVPIFVGIMINQQTVKLTGVLVDLEFGPPDPHRHISLRKVLTDKIKETAEGIRLSILIRYVHFLEMSESQVDPQRVDFIMLSPQSTPWHVYERECQLDINRLKELLKSTIRDYHVPVLGICGGHQFLAMTFGGSVGFIDPKFDEIKPDAYPKFALVERGEAILETLADDPLFRGVVKHPGAFNVSESHFEEVKKLPKPFVNLARSAVSEIQLLRLPERLVYGFAFHPERGWEQSNEKQGDAAPGKKLLQNFFSLVINDKQNKSKNPSKLVVHRTHNNGVLP